MIWDVVEVHYDNFLTKYRAVKYSDKDSKNIIIKEAVFSTRVEAENYVRKQKNESI